MSNADDVNKNDPTPSIFRSVPKWQDLRFYQKAVVLYHLTYSFYILFRSTATVP